MKKIKTAIFGAEFMGRVHLETTAVGDGLRRPNILSPALQGNQTRGWIHVPEYEIK